MIAFVVHSHSLSDWLTKRRAVCQTIRSKTTNFRDVRLIFPRYAWAVHIYIHNHGQSLGTLAFLECFPIRIGPTPPLNPQTTLDSCIQTFFLRVSTLYRVGEGELRENFENDALFYEGTHKLWKIMNTAVLLRLNNVIFSGQQGKEKLRERRQTQALQTQLTLQI